MVKERVESRLEVGLIEFWEILIFNDKIEERIFEKKLVEDWLEMKEKSAKSFVLWKLREESILEKELGILSNVIERLNKREI